MPIRTCIGCRRSAPVDELVRVVAGPGGVILEGRTQPGRGAWLCVGSRDCLEIADRRRTFARALRTEVDTSTIGSLRTTMASRGRIEKISQ